MLYYVSTDIIERHDGCGDDVGASTMQRQKTVVQRLL